MKCPNDNTVLQMTARSGVSIDYCPDCRGVWLDRNELDKIIEVENGVRDHSRHDNQRHEASRSSYDDEYDASHRRKRKDNFLGDLFDF